MNSRTGEGAWHVQQSNSQSDTQLHTATVPLTLHQSYLCCSSACSTDLLTALYLNS